MSQEHGRQPMLASDADRERSVRLLRNAVTEGRLTLAEFSERVQCAFAARTDLDLAALTLDLPAAPLIPGPHAEHVEEHRALCSHLTRAGPWSLPLHSRWRSLLGTIDLDLREAHLLGPETVLDVYNLFGTVTLLVPEGIEVVVSGGGLFASQRIQAPERAPVPGAPRLLVHTRGPGGTLNVRTRPSWTASLRVALRG